jgi:hypothetical protein
MTTISGKQQWRAILPVHPAAELLPRMTVTELKELGADIAANGLHTPIILLKDENGSEQLLDGVNRLDAMEQAGIEVVKDGRLDYDRVLHQHVHGNTDAYRFVLSVNLYRRHLTNEQKNDLIGKLLELKPTASDRQIAALTGTSHPTVAKVRREKEAGGKITTSPTRTGKDGVEQPATKPSKMVTPVEPVVAAGNGAPAAGEGSVPTGTDIAAAFDRLVPIEIARFLESISRGQRHRLEHALGHDDAAHAEIAKLAREAKAQLSHAEHNKDDIHKKLARIISLTDPDQKFRKTKDTKTHATIDPALFPHAMGMARH